MHAVPDHLQYPDALHAASVYKVVCVQATVPG